MECKLFLLLLWTILPFAMADDIEGDRAALLDFVSNINHTRDLNWSDSNGSICYNWTGITCDRRQSRVIAVRLPAIRFDGPIPSNTLGRLSALQILSLRSNGLTGPFPSQLLNITSLTGLHLQLNGFSGALPSDLSAWKNLTVLDLSHNELNGSIPASISRLVHLTALNLSNNSFSGDIPELELPNLRFLNLSNNLLDGSVPPPLLRFPDSSFSGNALTMPAAPAAAIPPPTPLSLPVIQSSPSSSPFPVRTSGGKRLAEPEILGIAAGGLAIIFIAMAILTVIIWVRKKKGMALFSSSGKVQRSPEKGVQVGGHRGGNDNRLVFFQGCSFEFDLEDLLRASAEVLGKGAHGTAYKAALEDAGTVVVKRLKEVGVGKREFEQLMEAVGRIKHENVAELRAYYYSKDEKLMVYDFYSQGSAAALLHGRRGGDRIPLDWDTRLKIAIGAARGIARIHTENKLSHGNIKSSNVFLNAQSFGCVSDLGLSALSTTPIVPRVSRAAGYYAPEIVDVRRSTQSSDVYSFGVFLLELLTGKSPIQRTGGGDEVVHLVRWVQSVVQEEWTAEVFDAELMRYPNIDEELVEMLQIGMACIVRMPERRPKMAEVVRLIEEVRRFDTVDRPSVDSVPPESRIQSA